MKKKFVILRDDDTNAFTPVDCLERLYRPFLDRGIPVNLATIPEVAVDAVSPDGSPEGFLVFAERNGEPTLPISQSKDLVRYLRGNPGFAAVQHGCHHHRFEFDLQDGSEAMRRISRGRAELRKAGLGETVTFVAPHDKISRESYRVLVREFGVISTGWFEWRRLCPSWLPSYAIKKLRNESHWSVGQARLLSHPGCLLSCFRQYDAILETIKEAIDSDSITVLVTHWWEYFREGKEDTAFVEILHETARYLSSRPDVQTLRFDDLPKV